MSEVKSGDTVSIHYTGTLSDGSVFDSSQGREPLEFVVGSGQIIPGLDTALPGMKVGDEKRVEIASDDAYGPHHAEARQAVPRAEIPADIPLEIGVQLQAKNERGEIMPLTVVEVSEETVVLDANHPLAGKDLTFEIELVAVS
ncbi:FKBP-type peptidyl-prolyl cis-trans isomerase [Lentibacter sp.]|uniref:FKBP-type peptidyl-prolyl cis-trans isomerase n=1 Tax=Lentibacter sp. TaxID=2024994 RepID=UPI003F6B7B10